jgi:hypothetical protein
MTRKQDTTTTVKPPRTRKTTRRTAADTGKVHRINHRTTPRELAEARADLVDFFTKRY